jgi:hypothetical protein
VPAKECSRDYNNFIFVGNDLNQPTMSSDSSSGAVPNVTKSSHSKQAALSCVPFFDKLWWCYTPAHQLTQLYRYGRIDTCASTMQNMIDCALSKTKNPAPERMARLERAAQGHVNPSAEEHFWDARE